MNWAVTMCNLGKKNFTIVFIFIFYSNFDLNIICVLCNGFDCFVYCTR